MADNPILFYSVWIAITFIIAGFLIAMLFVMEKMKRRNAMHLLKTTIEEQERMMKAISVEVHDNFNQMLNLASMTVYMIPEREENKEYKSNAVQILKTLIADAHYISRSLNSELLRRTGLGQSLQQIALWVNLSKKIECSVDIQGKKTNLNPEIELMSIRIAQEAINNAIKYAKSKSLEIILNYGEENLELTIADYGIGFDVQDPKLSNGVGIRSMHQRARLIQGKLELKSKQDVGTIIKLTVPK